MPVTEWTELQGRFAHLHRDKERGTPILEELQEKGLDMGHGSGIMGGKDFTKEDAWALMNLTKEIALLIDRKLGLKPDEGSF